MFSTKLELNCSAVAWSNSAPLCVSAAMVVISSSENCPVFVRVSPLPLIFPLKTSLDSDLILEISVPSGVPSASLSFWVGSVPQSSSSQSETVSPSVSCSTKSPIDSFV